MFHMKPPGLAVSLALLAALVLVPMGTVAGCTAAVFLLASCAVLTGPCRIESDVSADGATRTFECQAGGQVLVIAPSRALDAAGRAAGREEAP